MPADMVIKNAHLVEGTGPVGDGLAVVIDQGRIQAIARPGYVPDARVVIDASGKVVLPGLIDPHVHTREPGYEYKETILTCSTAAAAGGITLMLAMFNVKPLIMDVPGFQYFKALAARQSLINFNCIGVLVENGLTNISPLADAGIAAVKVLLGYRFDSTDRGADANAWNSPYDGELLEACRLMAERDLPLAAHAENDHIVYWQEANLRAKGKTEPVMHAVARPSVGEEEAMGRLITFAKEAGNRLHIVHLASGRAMEMARKAQYEGVRITIETCPHYLLMTNEKDVARLGSIAKINPPIRSAWDQETLWSGIDDGTVTMIGTDHSPHTPEEKRADKPFDNIFEAIAGFVGVETSASLLLTEVNRGRLSLERFVQLCSTGPAKTFGLYPDRGSLLVGTAADITIVDMEQESVIDAKKLHSKTRVTPWDGWRVKGIPTHTIVNGKVVYDQGQILGAPGDGVFVTARRSS
jgi:allantoinase